MLFKHLSLEMISHDPSVDKSRGQTDWLWEPFHWLAAGEKCLCSFFDGRHCMAVETCIRSKMQMKK